MKKISIKILIVGFLLTLVFPKGTGANSRLPVVSATDSLPVQTQTQVSVQVVQPVVSAKIIIVQNALPMQTVSNCGANFLGAVNLNEPANCFSLSLATQTNAAKVAISVAAISKTTQKVSVTDAVIKIASPSLSPWSIPQSVPVLPLVIFGLVVAFELVEPKKIFKANKKSTYSGFSFNFSRLPILRC